MPTGRKGIIKRNTDRVLGVVVTGLVAYSYVHTDSIFLLLGAAWLGTLVAFNILEAFLGTLGKGASTFEPYLSFYPLQFPIVGLAVGAFSFVANFTIQSHWFLLAHGIFWILLSPIVLGGFIIMNRRLSIIQTRYGKKLLPAFQNLGVHVQISFRDRPEKNITSMWRGRSMVFMDVTNGPIKWVNFKENRDDENTKYMEYGVPDPQVKPTFPKVRIKSERVRSAPCAGNIADVRWCGKDFGLGLIDRLNGDVSLRQLSTEGDVGIVAYPKDGCWILTEKTRSELPSKELWNCYDAIANHLLGNSPDSSG